MNKPLKVINTTEELREAIVDLLRAAGDGRYSGIAPAYAMMYEIDDILAEAYRREKHIVWDLAVKARGDTEACWEQWSTSGYPTYEETCLQAAQLVEDRLWPRDGGVLYVGRK